MIKIQFKFEELLHEIKLLLRSPVPIDAEQSLHTVIAFRKEELLGLIRHSVNTIRKVTGVDPHAAAGNNNAVPLKKMYDTFSDTEKLFISNAGLALLWPFLHRFFKNLGLAGEKAFVNEMAAEKACLLLQHITGVLPEDLF